MTDREIMQQALEALKKCRYRSLADEIVDPAITALHSRLAQPEQEPVLAEREACAKICEDLHPGLATRVAAEYIRARGQG